jgi:hypothetical protein
MFFQLHSSESPKSKNPPPDRFWRWVSVILLKIALLHHPFPSSRRHVIRVDMPVPVDVIRFAFWMRVLMKSRTANAQREYRTYPVQVKFKIVMWCIEISASGC